MLGAALTASACASLPEDSRAMPLGHAALAPNGFVDFCGRRPTDCGVSAAEVEQVRKGPASSATAVAAITFDWSNVFAKRATASPLPAASALEAVQPASFAAASNDLELAPAPQAVSFTAPIAMATSPLAPAARKVTLDSRTWGLLTKTNDGVNRAIAQREDSEVYGLAELWETPLERGLNAGDCEDYVLEKRRALISAGVPASALSIAVVETDRGQSHAVLLVATDKGEYVLDNLSAWILPWAKTSYRWRERQVDGAAFSWAYAATNPAPSPPATSSLLLASLR